MGSVLCVVGNIFFFKQKTAYEMRISDWSSDVCSSDLQVQAQAAQHLEDQVEYIGASDADRQHPQGGFGLVRHHAIVNVHHEQRRSHGDDVDQQAGEIGRASGRERVCQYV